MLESLKIFIIFFKKINKYNGILRILVRFNSKSDPNRLSFIETFEYPSLRRLEIQYHFFKTIDILIPFCEVIQNFYVTIQSV
jgi:hypothetical protein